MADKQGWPLVGMGGKFEFVILDDGSAPGGAWRHGWDSLTLFSPAGYSSLPGWPMPQAEHASFPARDDVIAYLTAYETRYNLPVLRPVKVLTVSSAAAGRLLVATDSGNWLANTVISASGTWSTSYIPDVLGRTGFNGVQMHSAHYQNAAAFEGRKVLVVGDGSSGAQIHAELSQTSDSTWVTQTPPVFLPDDVDGRVLFDRASAIHRGEHVDGLPISFANVVMVPPVRTARDRGDLSTALMFERMTANGVKWRDGTSSSVDATIWCTGFRPRYWYFPLSLRVMRAERSRLGIASSMDAALFIKRPSRHEERPPHRGVRAR